VTDKIAYLAVGWAVETSGDPQQITVDLAAMRRHCRPERVEELLDDLAMICQDVLTAQEAEGAAGSNCQDPWIKIL
jgi:hypothetical protein